MVESRSLAIFGNVQILNVLHVINENNREQKVIELSKETHVDLVEDVSVSRVNSFNGMNSTVSVSKDTSLIEKDEAIFSTNVENFIWNQVMVLREQLDGLVMLLSKKLVGGLNVRV